jgi:hypothetical protein
MLDPEDLLAGMCQQCLHQGEAESAVETEASQRIDGHAGFEASPAMPRTQTLPAAPEGQRGDKSSAIRPRIGSEFRRAGHLDMAPLSIERARSLSVPPASPHGGAATRLSPQQTGRNRSPLVPPEPFLAPAPLSDSRRITPDSGGRPGSDAGALPVAPLLNAPRGGKHPAPRVVSYAANSPAPESKEPSSMPAQPRDPGFRLSTGAPALSSLLQANVSGAPPRTGIHRTEVPRSTARFPELDAEPGGTQPLTSHVSPDPRMDVDLVLDELEQRLRLEYLRTYGTTGR